MGISLKRLRCDENHLRAIVALADRDKHVGSYLAIDGIHVDVVFVQTANRAASGLPKGQEETDSREGSNSGTLE